MKWKKRASSLCGRILSYLKDHRFSSILLKYFLLLFVCLILPIIILIIWYGNQTRENLREELIRRNEASLQQSYDNVNSVMTSAKNLAYSLSADNLVQYLAIKDSVSVDNSNNLNNLCGTISLLEMANEYIDSVCIYFRNADEIASKQGCFSREKYQDSECFDFYSTDMSNRTTVHIRKKNGKYPYLITILCPISVNQHSNYNNGAVAVNIDVEALGEYLGSGGYRNKNYMPMLIILDEKRETLIYSDEWRLLREGIEIFRELESSIRWEPEFSQACTLWGNNYMVSGVFDETNGFWYLYLTSMQQYEVQNQAANRLLRNAMILMSGVCVLVAVLLTVLVYRPIQRTLQVLNEVSLLVEWDKKANVNEMELIQRSILSAKRKQDDLNEQIKERIISLHNAQICALQMQINPHFLYNTLEAIGNAAALLMNGDNKVTETIYTLGRLMRISLAGENYLVPIEEELEHVRLYVKLMDFRFRKRICMHVEIPEVLYKEKIVKLTLQPLIENAIEHGLARTRSQGDIWLKGEMRGDHIYLYVVDNGEGISQDLLEKLREELGVSSIKSSVHIGLRNVNQRLKLVFGEECGLNVETLEGGGACVMVHLKKISVDVTES